MGEGGRGGEGRGGEGRGGEGRGGEGRGGEVGGRRTVKFFPKGCCKFSGISGLYDSW